MFVKILSEMQLVLLLVITYELLLLIYKFELTATVHSFQYNILINNSAIFVCIFKPIYLIYHKKLCINKVIFYNLDWSIEF